MFLGMAAFIQPVTRTCWWLFVSQGRSREMLRVGILSCGASIAAIFIGLPWGTTGVAAAYGLTELLVAAPLIFWLAARRGPIRMGDFYRTIAPAAFAAVCALGVVFALRPWLQEFHLVWRLVFALGATAATSLVVLASLPAGRGAIKDSKQVFYLLIGVRNKLAAR
jgi:PST family polysaccharide transporter